MDKILFKKPEELRTLASVNSALAQAANTLRLAFLSAGVSCKELAAALSAVCSGKTSRRGINWKDKRIRRRIKRRGL